MGTIWVSKNGSNFNSGLSSSPLKTIQAAVDRASEGAEIKVKAGTYTENISIRKDGISLFSADGQYAAKIEAASQTRAAISGFGNENTKIVNFDIIGPSKANGIHFGMSGNNFTDLVKNLMIKGNKIHGSGQDGIKVSQADNVKILDNKITNSGDQGIDFVAVNGSKISGNTVVDADGPSALMVKGGSSNVTIDNNKVYDVKSVGISVGGWSSENWMRPGTRHFEAKNLDVTGNTVWDTGKSAILVSGAHNSHIAGNFLDSNMGYDAVVWLDRSAGTHATAIYTKNTNLKDNTFLRSDWLRVNEGNNYELVASSNEISKDKVMSAQKGAFGSSDNEPAGGSTVTALSIDKVATNSTSANHATVVQIQSPDDKAIDANSAPEVIAIDKDELSTGNKNSLLNKMPLLLQSDDGVLVYTPEQEVGSEMQARGNVGSDDLLFFNLFKQVTSADVSSVLIKWQALEDAVSQVEAVPVDTTHQQDNHQIDVHANWLLG